MDTKRLIFGLVVAATTPACSCNDRTVAEDPMQDELRDEERSLCARVASWQKDCISMNGLDSTESTEDRLERCMEAYFSSDIAVCRPVALTSAACEPTQSCEYFPYTGTAIPPCQEVIDTFGVCFNNPESWEE